MLLLVPVLVGMTGCNDPKERFGRTWYIDGAGNWGFGVLESAVGLEKAGYKGLVQSYHWSLTFNPALDQTLRFVAKGGGERLGGIISDYLDRFPDANVNVIGLSAGTGVGIWAIESVRSPHKINNYVMLGSSLSSRYDPSRALSKMKGKIFTYFSASDPVLNGAVRALGTIDGTFDDSAGLVGLRARGPNAGRIVNIGWSSKYERYGWVGGHTDGTSEDMMHYEIGPRIFLPDELGPAAAPRKTAQVDAPARRADRGSG
ncbi:MAG: hypothetical protein U1A27_10920 [Phycisphaerae bacterium]